MKILFTDKGRIGAKIGTIVKMALPPNPPTPSSGLLNSVLPLVKNLRLSGGQVPPHPLAYIVRIHAIVQNYLY